MLFQIYNIMKVRSSIVGTIYRAPSPTLNVYWNLGSLVKIGSVLCYCRQLLKLMNEIGSDCDGTWWIIAEKENLSSTTKSCFWSRRRSDSASFWKRNLLVQENSHSQIVVKIALRVIRAARELGIKTVAVYSEADRDFFQSKFADESLCIGRHEQKKVYLNIPRLISAGWSHLMPDAIHPRYGFLRRTQTLRISVLRQALSSSVHVRMQ